MRAASYTVLILVDYYYFVNRERTFSVNDVMSAREGRKKRTPVVGKNARSRYIKEGCGSCVSSLFPFFPSFFPPKLLGEREIKSVYRYAGISEANFIYVYCRPSSSSACHVVEPRVIDTLRRFITCKYAIPRHRHIRNGSSRLINNSAEKRCLRNWSFIYPVQFFVVII